MFAGQERVTEPKTAWVKHFTNTHNNNCSDVALVYICKDHHCFPITYEKLKLFASKANQGDCNDPLNYMSDSKWSGQHENIFRLKDLNYILSLQKENHIIILPEDVKMSQAVDAYINKTNFYVEYMHWDNSGILDGFIDQSQTMNTIFANQPVINYSKNTRKMTSNGPISFIRLLHHLCINICVVTYLKEQEGIWRAHACIR